jgi:hypothetical protein
MKIAVFGDSFADKSHADSQDAIWYNFLQHEHGHEVTCWGEAGSSILFSAELIQKHARDYDLAIWCLTTPGRFSLPHNFHDSDRHVHVTAAWSQCLIDNIEIRKKHAACIDYLKYIFDWDTENFVGRAVVSYVQQQNPNLMVIPCFPPPLDTKFNLYTLCEWEAGFYFPGKTIPDIYQRYHDLRPGHISRQNQRLLADLISKELKPGVFQTSYENFQAPSQPMEEVFARL